MQSEIKNKKKEKHINVSEEDKREMSAANQTAFLMAIGT